MLFKWQSLGQFATQHETITNTSTDRVGRAVGLMSVKLLNLFFFIYKIVTTNDAYFTGLWWELSEMGYAKRPLQFKTSFLFNRNSWIFKISKHILSVWDLFKTLTNKLLYKPERLPAMLCGSEAKLIIYVHSFLLGACWSLRSCPVPSGEPHPHVWAFSTHPRASANTGKQMCLQLWRVCEPYGKLFSQLSPAH